MLWNRRFLANFVKFVRKPLLQNNHWRLILRLDNKVIFWWTTRHFLSKASWNVIWIYESEKARLYRRNCYNRNSIIINQPSWFRTERWYLITSSVIIWCIAMGYYITKRKWIVSRKKLHFVITCSDNVRSWYLFIF